jgi:hypothetical protein
VAYVPPSRSGCTPFLPVRPGIGADDAVADTIIATSSRASSLSDPVECSITLR